MEVRAFAEAVLFSGDLDQKLGFPTDLTDSQPGSAIDVPHVPGRPQWLPMVTDKPIPPPPTPSGLESERARGHALHSFAHHELQALELMALALLRFPDAPKGFRMGLAHIIRDEQRHFRMYQVRSERWGVGLGEVGMGHFFWSTVAPISHPADFLAALSLTYEQANLDFSKYWADAFRAVDDHASADVLQVVYEDEITHVEHGVTWFERLAGKCDFQTYRKRLIFPLSPGRGKGPIFDRAGRERAGFSADFIDEMEITNVSRGRPPRMFSFEPFVEERAAGRTPKKEALALQADLATLPMFLAHREDVVLAPRPSIDCLRRLHKMGVGIPEFAPSTEAMGDRLLGKPVPWGRVEDVRRFDKIAAVRLREAFCEAFDHPFLAPFQAIVAHDPDAVAPRLGQSWIAKAPLSAAGQRRVLLDHPNAAQWVERQLANGPITVEPWYTRCIDLSVQLEVEEQGARTLGTSRFWTAANGAYRGAVLGSWTQGLSADVLREIHGGGKQSHINGLLTDMAHFVGEHMHAQGYRGPVGIDAMVVHTVDGLRLLPILELNPRLTMGRIALAMHKQMGLRGGWFFVSDAALQGAGFANRSEFVTQVRKAEGLVFTTDPATATHTLTVASVAKGWPQAVAQWTATGMPWPSESTTR